MSAPLVAVVTPVYNGEPHLERSLASIQAQTYPNLVHVVLDNASTDRTAELLDAASKGPVPLIRRRNDHLLPLALNWNAAIAMCPPDAKYLKFNAADDLIRRDCISRMVDVAESDPEIDYVCAIDVFNGKTKPFGLDPDRQVYVGREFAAAYLRERVPWLSATHLFYRVTPDRLKDPFPLDVWPMLDADFILRDLLSRKMGYIAEPLTFTRYDGGTVTASLGGFRSYIFPTYQLLLRHGRKYLPEAEFEQLKRRGLKRVIRHVTQWLATGDGKNAGAALSGLARENLTPRALDYFAAAIAWPFYKFGASMRAPREQVTSISEDDFLAYIPELDGADGQPGGQTSAPSKPASSDDELAEAVGEFSAGRQR